MDEEIENRRPSAEASAARPSSGHRLRVGIIGTGWGGLVHVPAFTAVPEYELVALCGRSPTRVAAAAQRTGIDDVSHDWRLFVARPDLDLISVATPVTEHFEMASTALENGKHVLCEKPLASTAAEAARLSRLAEDGGLTGSVCFEWRWSPPRAALRSVILSGRIGVPVMVRVSHTYNYWHPTQRPQAPWMYNLEEGGGYLNGLLSHDLDFLCWLFGRPVAVCADVRSITDRVRRSEEADIAVTADDTCALLIRFSTGPLAAVSLSVTGRVDGGGQLEVVGSGGVATHIYSSPADGQVFVRDGVAEEAVPVQASERLPRSGYQFQGGIRAAAGKAMACLLEDWLPAFSGEETDVPTFQSGLLTQQLIEAARQSSDEGTWIRL
jgi:predicted dehydrogenase